LELVNVRLVKVTRPVELAFTICEFPPQLETVAVTAIVEAGESGDPEEFNNCILGCCWASNAELEAMTPAVF
jgi:hypothetical protein